MYILWWIICFHFSQDSDANDDPLGNLTFKNIANIDLWVACFYIKKAHHWSNIEKYWKKYNEFSWREL